MLQPLNMTEVEMRNNDWPEKASDLISSRFDTPFKWGTHDCCLFAADVVLAMTGKDYAETFRGRYKSETGAKRLLAKAGGLEKFITDSGFEEIELNFGQRGDLVLVQTDLGPALGIKWLGNSLWLHTPDGVRMFSDIDNLILKTWRV